MAAAAVLTVSLSSCADHVGAAATVGSASIDESSVTQTSAQLTAGQPTALSTSDQQSLNRKVLTAQIRHALLSQTPAVTSAAVTDAQVNSFAAHGAAQIAADLGVTVDQVPQTVRDSLTVLALAQRDASSKKRVTDVQVTVDIVNTFTTRADAVAARQQYLTDPSAMNRAAAGKDQTGQNNGGIDRSANLLDSAGLAPLGLFSEPVGGIVVISSGSQWSLARITHRTVAASDQLPAAIQAAESAQQPDPAAVFDLAWLALGPYVSSQHVSVNPRFGTWDPVSLQVVPTNSGL